MARSILLVLFALFAVALANTRHTTTHRPPVAVLKQYLLTTTGSCGKQLSMVCQPGSAPAGRSLSSPLLSSSVSSGGKSSVTIKLQEIAAIAASSAGASRD